MYLKIENIKKYYSQGENKIEVLRGIVATLDNADFRGSVFNVSVNNRPWLNHFSPAIEVGGNRCISKKLHVAVTGGNLTVNFEAVKGMTFLNGIKIFRIH